MVKKLIECTGMVLIILLMAVAVLVFLAPRSGWRVDAVFSGSMEPELKAGGVVITRPVKAEAIGVGDIVTFYSPLNMELTSHRVIAAGDSPSSPFLTKGDANEDADPFVLTADSVVGTVCFHVPYFGYVTRFIRTTWGLLLTLCLPGLIIIVLEIRKIWMVLVRKDIERKYFIR
jgi:signal peptidase